MSRKYQREEDELDRLIKENRQLKATNKSLLKRLRTLNKGYYKFLFNQEEGEENTAKESAKEIAKKICYVCNIGEMKMVDLGSRYFRKCNNESCENRTKSKTKKAKKV